MFGNILLQWLHVTNGFYLHTVLSLILHHVHDLSNMVHIIQQKQEQKKHQELLAALKKGDRVVTGTGMHATIHEVRGDQLVLEIADRVRVLFDRSSVQRKAEADQAKE